MNFIGTLQVCNLLSNLGKKRSGPELTNCYECCTKDDGCNANLCGQRKEIPESVYGLLTMSSKEP